MKGRKIRLQCSGQERKILWESLLLFRNRVLREGKPTEDLDRLLRKILPK